MPPIADWLAFIHTPSFDNRWDRLGLGDEDLARLQRELIGDPRAGDVVSQAGGLRKLRFAPDGQGKSGGVRVWYAYFPNHGIILLAIVYGKRAKSDLAPAEKKAVAQLLRDVERRLANFNPVDT